MSDVKVEDPVAEPSDAIRAGEEEGNEEVGTNRRHALSRE